MYSLIDAQCKIKPSSVAPISRTDAIFTASKLDRNKFSPILSIFDELLKSQSGIYIAGGSIRRLVNNESMFNADIDVYFATEQAFRETFNYLVSKFNYTPSTTVESLIKRSSRHLCIDLVHPTMTKIQLIKSLWFPTAIDVIDAFDLRLVQFATDGIILYCNEKSFSDLKEKRINIHRVTNPGQLITKITKYSKLGFSADPAQIKPAIDKFINQVVNDINSGVQTKIADELQIWYKSSPKGANAQSISVNEKWILDNWCVIRHSKFANELFEQIYGYSYTVND